MKNKYLVFMFLGLILFTSFFIAPNTSHAVPRDAEGEWLDVVEAPTELGATTSFIVTCQARGGRDCKFVVPFDGVYRIQGDTIRDDNPRPAVAMCLNKTGKMWDGACKYYQGGAGAEPILDVGADKMTHAVINVRVNGSKFNRNDFEGQFTLIREEREVTNLSSCLINDFHADDRDVDYNTGTNLRYDVETYGDVRWVIENLRTGATLISGTDTVNNFKPTGNLTERDNMYRLSCFVVGGNQDGELLRSKDETITVIPPTCKDPKASNVGGPLPCTYAPGERVDGSCKPTHYECFSPGKSVEHKANSNEWTWTCEGTDGGHDASCQESKNNTPPPSCNNGATNSPACNQCPSGQALINGSCVVPPPGTCMPTHYNCPAGSTLGAFEEYPGQYNWWCSGVPTLCVEYKPCTNGASNPPSCNVFGSCPNGASNPPTCDSFPPPSSCSNGATNPPACNSFPSPTPCSNGATNPPSCNNFPVGNWSEWSECSATICGRTGTQTRTCSGGTCSGASSQSCSAPACPTGNISATSCTIPGGASTCNSFVTWNTQNLTAGATEVTRNNPRNTSVSSSPSGTSVANIINYNASTFFLYHNLYGVPTSLARVNVNASCSSGSIWDGTKCKAVPGSLSGTLLPDTLPTCNIPIGADSCAINFSWQVENPLEGSVSAVTRNPNNTTVGTGHTGNSQPFVVKHGIETFYLYNSKSTRELAETTVAGVCAPGAAWDIGSGKCQSAAVSSCGNGVIDGGEQCDDGNQYNGQCPSNCSIACTIRSCVAPGDIDINVRPNVIVAGGSANLTWVWDGSESCSGVNFDTGGATSGTVEVKPNSTTTYKINCGTETAQTTLTVKKKPKFNEN